MKALQKGIAKLFFFIAYPVLRLIYPVSIEWEDKKATKKVLKERCVVFSNHNGYVDGLYMTRLLRPYKVYTYVGKDWYEKKSINWLFRNLPYLPVDRKQMDTSWLDEGMKRMEEGKSIYIFPEGHTAHGGDMDEFKPGFLVLAKRANCPVVPICLHKNFELFHKSRITIGAPMYPDLNEDGRPSLVMKKHAKICRDKIVGMMEE